MMTSKHYVVTHSGNYEYVIRSERAKVPGLSSVPKHVPDGVQGWRMAARPQLQQSSVQSWPGQATRTLAECCDTL